MKTDIQKARWNDLKAAVGIQAQAAKSGKSLSLDDLLLNIKGIGLNSLVCQTEIQTEADKKRYLERGYRVYLTEAEFRQKFTVDPACIWYTPSYSMDALYFNPDTFAACQFQIEIMLAKEQGSGIGLDPDSLYRAIEIREREAAKQDYIGSALSLNDAMRLDYLQLIAEKKGSGLPGLYHLFTSIYCISDYGFGNLDWETMKTIRDAKTDAEKEETALSLNELPDPLTIYRGGNSASADYRNAYSWTLNPNVANFFAIRRGEGPAYIVKAVVPKADVIEYLKDRNEQEIIVDPAAVKVVEITELKGVEFLQEMIPQITPMYLKFRQQLMSLDFSRDTSIHGKQHCARVLFLTLLMSEMQELPASDRKILATAAIFHDSRRDTDEVEPGHGRAGKEYYRTVTAKPDPLVEFLCEFHCLPDEQGYEEIMNSRQLSKNRTRAKRLLDIFKDADGLERVRLGNIMREMDLSQYRLPVSKELTLVARICMENIRLS